MLKSDKGMRSRRGGKRDVPEQESIVMVENILIKRGQSGDRSRVCVGRAKQGMAAVQRLHQQEAKNGSREGEKCALIRR